MAKVSINLVTYNGEKYISPCLSSVLNQTFKDFQLIIIENGSSDGTMEEISNWKRVFTDAGIGVKVIYNEKNAGFAEGHNQGIREADSIQKKKENRKQKADDSELNTETAEGTTPPPYPLLREEGGAKEIFAKGENYGFASVEYILCLNQDIIMESDYLEKMVEFMDAHPKCGSGSGKLLRLHTNKHELEPVFADRVSPKALAVAQSYDKAKHESTRMLDYEKLARESNVIDSVGLKIFKSNRVIEIGQSEEDKGQYDDVKEVFGVSGALPMYRFAALEDVKIKVGAGPRACPYEYFDKDFENYKEDVDLAYRLRWRGWKSYVFLGAVAFHERGAKQAAGGESDWTASSNRKNKSKYANYCSQRNQIWMLIKNLPKLNFAVFWYEFKKFGYELIFEWSTFKAWIDVFKKMRKMKSKRKWIMRNRRVEWEEMRKWTD